MRFIIFIAFHATLITQTEQRYPKNNTFLFYLILLVSVGIYLYNKIFDVICINFESTDEI